MEARIEVINQCSYQCEFCPVHTQTRKITRMRWNLFLTVLGRLKDYKTITFTGMGEPTLNPELMTFIIAAKNRGYNTILVTNLSQPPPMTNLDWLHISWYNKKEQEDNLNYILSLKGRPKIKLVYTPIDSGQYDSVRFIETWRDKVDRIEVWKPHNWGGTFNYREQKKKKNCDRVKKELLQVQSNGEVVACCLCWDSEIVLGDLKTQTVDEIFTSKKYTGLWKDYYPDKCKNCEFRNEDNDSLIYHHPPVENRIKKTSTTLEEL